VSKVNIFLPVHSLNTGNHHSTRLSIPDHLNTQQRRSENFKYLLLTEVTTAT